MSNPGDPRDEELASLYRESALEQPPPALDARILAAARATATPAREDSTPPRTTSWLNRWRLPFALAATVLMTSTLTLMVREQKVDEIAVDGVPVGRAAPATETPRAVEQAAEARQPAPAASTRKSAPAAAATAPQAAARAPDRSARDNAGGSAHKPEAGSDAPSREQGNSRNLAKDQPGADAAAKTASPTATQSRPATPAAPAALSAPTPAAASTERGLRRENSASSAESGGPDLSPEHWLDRIRALRREGRTIEADASLAQFRKHYPQFPLPDDMRQP